jgi:hypothetical protein
MRAKVPAVERQNIEESLIRREASNNPELDVMLMSAEDRILSLGPASKADSLQPGGEMVGGEERMYNVDTEREVMSMTAEDRILSLGPTSKADSLPPGGEIVGGEERKYNVDSETEVLSMTAEDRIKAGLLKVEERAGVSKSEQFQDRTLSTANPHMLSEVWPTEEKPVFRNDIAEIALMSVNDKILLQQLEMQISRARNGFRPTKSAMGRWTKNKQKGWELVRRAEKIDPNKQEKEKTGKIKPRFNSHSGLLLAK